MCDRRPKPFWFRRQRQKGALHLQQVAPVHFQWHRSLYRSLYLAIAAAPLHLLARVINHFTFDIFDFALGGLLHLGSKGLCVGR